MTTEEKTLLYKTDASYADDNGKGENPLDLRFEVHRAGDQGIYNEIAVDCFNQKGEMVGNALIGLCMDKKDMRVMLTTDGVGCGDHEIAVYPMRPKKEAVEDNRAF